MYSEKEQELISLLLECMYVPQTIGEDIDREAKMIEWIKWKIPHIQQDNFGNLYIINPWTPLLCAHMDTVGSQIAQENVHNISIHNVSLTDISQTTTAEKFTDETIDDTFPITVKNAYNTIAKFKAKTDIIKWTHNIGADDKCWVAIVLQLYADLWDNISILFTRAEETWRLGSQYFTREHKDLLDQCTYMVIADRRNGDNLIWRTNDYCTTEFQNKILIELSKFGYKTERWMSSDCDSIKEILNSTNLSCGYYNPHCDNEYVVIQEFVNCFYAINSLLLVFNDKLEPYKKVESVYNAGTRNKTSTPWDWNRTYWTWRKKWYEAPVIIEQAWWTVTTDRQLWLFTPEKKYPRDVEIPQVEADDTKAIADSIMFAKPLEPWRSMKSTTRTTPAQKPKTKITVDDIKQFNTLDMFPVKESSLALWFESITIDDALVFAKYTDKWDYIEWFRLDPGNYIIFKDYDNVSS